jgi:beta-mannosidase
MAVLLCLSVQVGWGSAVSLNGRWDLSFWEQPEIPVRTPADMRMITSTTIAAQVPGNVELALLAAGLIHDPMIGNNVWEMRPYEGYQWCYSRTFVSPVCRDGQRVFLRFGGIDCLADIWLNGEQVASTDNMLIEHTFDVTHLLKPQQENRLQVIIRSAVIEAQNYFLNFLTHKGNTANNESVNIRKAPHSYGWDILPRLVSAGLWRDVELQIVDPVRFTDVFWATRWADADGKRACVMVDYQLKIPFKELDKHKVTVRLKRNNKVVYEHSDVLYTAVYGREFTLENVDLWWPRGYGEPALYEAEVFVEDHDGHVLASDKKLIGIRTVALDYTELTTPEQPGEFCFKVNGEKIFIKGSNWVPVDALHSRDAGWLSQVMDMAADINCNMLRCWGGNVYEDHAFFDLCDRYGILVWQDFAMGCDLYSQGDEFARKIQQEAVSLVVKLRNHPSLALWAGNNENDQGFNGRGGAFNLDANRDRTSRRVIPDVLFEYDPTRPYLPSSPYYTPAFFKAGRNDRFLPEQHLWGPRGYYKAKFYTDVLAHFVSEIGYHGCPNRESLEKMFTKDCVYPWKKGTMEWNDEWQTKASRYHQYSNSTIERNNLMINQVRELFGEVPTDLDQFIFASQTVQAEAMKYFVEFWRMDKFSRTGILWWNLRDGWPLVSDAITDYYCSKKMAYYYIKQVQYDACVMIGDAREGNHPVVAVNDTRVEKHGTVTVKDLNTKRILFSAQFIIPVNGKTTIGSISETGVQSMWLIEYTIGNEKYMNHYLAGKAPFKLSDYKKWYAGLSSR